MYVVHSAERADVLACMQRADAVACMHAARRARRCACESMYVVHSAERADVLACMQRADLGREEKLIVQTHK